MLKQQHSNVINAETFLLFVSGASKKKGFEKMEEKVLQVIAEILEVSPDRITPTTMIQDVEEWDSLAQVMLIGALQEELGIEISIEEAAEMTGVADILAKCQ
jgi:acyl carrier protein